MKRRTHPFTATVAIVFATTLLAFVAFLTAAYFGTFESKKPVTDSEVAAEQRRAELRAWLGEVEADKEHHDRYLEAVVEFRQLIQRGELLPDYLATCELNAQLRGITVMVKNRWHLESQTERLALAKEVLAVWAQHLDPADQRLASIQLVDSNMQVVGGSTEDDPASIWVEEQ